MKVKKVTPRALSVMDKHNLLNFDLSPIERVKVSYEIYKNEESVKEIAQAIFEESELKDVNYSEFDINVLREGIESFLYGSNENLEPSQKKNSSSK